MGQINNPNLSKFFCGLLFPSTYDTDEIYKLLESKFKNDIDIKSGIIDFNFTTYYNPEMGDNLKRQWISFKTLLNPDKLADIKVMTNDIEDSLAKDNKRIINIDPGYITPANIILASTKDFSHRIYLAKGIYAEVTTIYKKEGFVKLPWTYPDYLCPAAVDFMIKARQCLLKPK
ncbi:MAG: DUF4416 family protein [Endomicrobiaceae bacterium]|jgi:hypothetical protein|nr:DUF4416 family protein [Endomicrobiaceae bacterium]MDD3730384.1 DUF4416 family protein [Endomicrobiaceae bacterium]MDD4166028.1 DUF4416 family protein [Endomicrobiaceae bacterium]